MEHLIFFLGILAYVQCFFLPGALLLKGLRYRTNLLQFFLVSAGLSLVVNYVLVYMLVLLGGYATPILRSIVGVEVIAALFMYRYALRQRLSSFFDGKNWSGYFQYLFKDHFSAYHVIVFVVAVMTIVLFGAFFANHFGQVFHVDDEVASWNLWALAWAGGHFPEASKNMPGLYPQLIPINFSVIYVLMGRVGDHPFLVTFARAIMPLFPIACMLMLLDLSVKSRQTRYLLAIPLLGLMLMIMLGKYIARGFVDIPLATLSFLAIYVLLSHTILQAKLHLRDVIVLAILAGGIGVTKQGGLYVALVLPFFAYHVLGREGLITVSKTAFFTASYALVAFLIIPWYWHTQSVVHHFNIGNVAYLSHGIYIQEHRNTFFARVAWIVKKTAFPFMVYLGFAVYAMRRERLAKSIMCFTIPYIIIWAVFFSYDPRNLALSMPLVSLIAAVGLEQWLFQREGDNHVLHILQKRLNVAMVLVLVVITVSVASVMKKLGYTALFHDQQMMLKKDAGDENPKSGPFHFYPL